MKFFALALIVLMVYVIGIQACSFLPCESAPKDLICVMHGNCYEDLRNECMYKFLKECTDLSIGLASDTAKSCTMLNVEPKDLCKNRKVPQEEPKE